MSLFAVLLLSIVEGVTEFLPISSTAHMSIIARIMNIPQTESLSAFIISIQVGALIAGAIFILRSLKITKHIFICAVIAFIPTGLIGFLFYSFIKNVFLGNMLIMALAILVGGIVILLVDKNTPSQSNSSGPRVGSPDTEELLQDSAIKELTYKNAFILGLVQTLAFIPGVSRSGALIIGGKLLKYDRPSIVVFTFLLGLPTLGAATIYYLYKTHDILTKSLGYEIILGAIISGIVAYIFAKWFLHYVTNHSFKIFGWYRIALGFVILLILFIK